jgi:XRE family aerobic/anaerobic benzoate catabolism transcriptional regulator
MTQLQQEAARGPDEEAAGAYISKIADRIKSIRIRRGMTRKLLSVHSEISERYLSQIESGQANLSVALLWRIAHAMDVEVQELLPDCQNCKQVPAPLFGIIKKLDSAQAAEAGRLLAREILGRARGAYGLALIGLRGSGKSELGRSLSKLTGVPFVNLVEVIEDVSGMEVGELFSLGGQKAYRRYEYLALEKVIGGSSAVILEVGGSLVTRTDTYHLLQQNYLTVWVKAAPEEHMERVMAQGDFRPMQGNEDAMEDLKRILREREPEYRTAHLELDTSGKTVEACLQELHEHARNHLEWRTTLA